MRIAACWRGPTDAASIADGEEGTERFIDGGSARPANLGDMFVREGDLLVCINFLSFFDMHSLGCWCASPFCFAWYGLHCVRRYGAVYRVRQCCMRFLVLSSVQWTGRRLAYCCG